MSRQIDLSKSLSKEDRRYLEDRGRWAQIAQADGTSVKQALDKFARHGSSAGPSAAKKTAGTSESSASPDDAQKGLDDESLEDWAESLTVPQLKEELSKRNVDDLSGKKDDLVDRLLDKIEKDEQNNS